MTEPNVLEMKPRQTSSPMVRAVNQGLMVAWINHDLLERSHLDVRTALVIYDEEGDFLYALPPVMGPVPNPGLQNALMNVGGRFYSTGIV